MGFALPLVIVTLGVFVGSLPYWLPLSVPGAGLAHEIPQIKLAAPKNIIELCGTEQKLVKGQRLFQGKILQSETVSVSPGGVLYAGEVNGKFWSAQPTGDGGYQLSSQPLADVAPGRPMGFTFDKDGNIIFCQFGTGLMKLYTDTGKVDLLTSHVGNESALSPGSPIYTPNDVDIAQDGTIYFTDSSTLLPPPKDGKQMDLEAAFQLTFMQGAATGRLIKYSPDTGKTEVISEGIWFANGIALSADESFLVVAETPGLRAYKYWIKGDKAGELELLIDGLPGYPDGVGLASDGNFWITLVAPPLPMLPVVQTRLARLLISYLPKEAAPVPDHVGAIVKVTSDGKVVDCLLDLKATTIGDVSSAFERDGRVYFGNVRGDYISYLDLGTLPKLKQESAQTETA